MQECIGESFHRSVLGDERVPWDAFDEYAVVCGAAEQHRPPQHRLEAHHQLLGRAVLYKAA